MKLEKTLPGKTYPLGADVCNGGVNFAIFSRHATKCVLNFFEKEEDKNPSVSIELDPKKNRTGDIWHIFVQGLKAGALYLYQFDGPFEPTLGQRYNFHQFLLDPRAKAVTQTSIFHNLPPNYRTPIDKLDMNHFESNKFEKFPKCVVIDDNEFDWEGDKPINRPLADSIIYEVHTKGFTAGKNSGVKNPGTYDGFTEKIPYLKSLGITAVELLPIYDFDEYENTNINPRTGERLNNYWGYSTISFFAPKTSFSSDKTPGGCVREFKTLVKKMHEAGLEVILDVVFNHTAEGNEHGISLNFRGIDNTIYYHLVDQHQEYYMNFSGCGNTFRCNQPVVREFILDCLRYWVLQYHIDGFRFDLAPILCRNQDGGGIIQFPALTNEIAEDPVLACTKIIAEPWDAGGAYLLGGFPGGRWAEWNDRYRDDIRLFWRGDEYASTAAATRMSGSSDLFSISGRSPAHSINFITCHDGFTLNDLVSYNHKHNEENGEENRDGTDSNWSYNHGFEGPTKNPVIERNRLKKIRNFILTLLISEGTPMILGGDEFRRTQGGNNNAYCQDNETSWFDWTIAEQNAELTEFVKRAVALRKNHAVFHRKKFFDGAKAGSVPDIQWYNSDGSSPDWNKLSRFVAYTLFGQYCKNEDGKSDCDFYIAANTDPHDLMITIPTVQKGKKWYLVADTDIEGSNAIAPEGKEEQLQEQEHYVIPANSMILLKAK